MANTAGAVRRCRRSSLVPQTWPTDAPNGLQDFRCILLLQSMRALDKWQFIVDGQRVTVGIKGPLVINDVEACIRAALRGVGLFRLPRSLVMSHLVSGDLETVLDSYSEEVPGLSLY